MKYMGSKRWMLRNGLGDLIAREVQGAGRFVDLFSGSSAVAAHVATRCKIPVVACDLQVFSAILARSVIGRTSKIGAEPLWNAWYERAKRLRKRIRPPSSLVVTQSTVLHHRQWSARQAWPVTKSYGGYYFSSLQAVWLDALRGAIPKRSPERTVALAALLVAASECAAAPGHTAQPFRPSRTAKPFLKGAWHKDVVRNCRDALFAISERYAKVRGTAEVGDANQVAASLKEEDVAFIDPPYSGVHYSRFYHVLETLARGRCGDVSGTGRYPSPSERPHSKYSVQSESSEALDDLFETISLRRAKAIVTFPQRQCSNGLSGAAVTALARKHFAVEQHWVASKFSTLGGNNHHRDARRATRELILVLRPR